jgi:hypothetical protein
MELTDIQKKTLQRFSLYCQSQNKTKVSFNVDIQDCSIEYFPNSFFDENGGSEIDGYDKINNLMEELSGIFETQLSDSISDCDDYAQLKFIIDCTENDLTIEVFENFRQEAEDGGSSEIPDDEHFRTLTEYMKKNGYTIGSVTFNGGGDDGYIEGTIQFSGGGSGRAPLNRFGNVYDYLYDMLEEILPGWELDAGSAGFFQINLNDNMIYLNISIYSYEMEQVDTLARFEF